MNKDWDKTILHLDLISWLGEKLAGNHLAIYRHSYDQLSFGSWQIEVETRHKRRRFIWDGKELSLSGHEMFVPDSRSVQKWKEIDLLSVSGGDQDEVFERVFQLSLELEDV